MASKRDIRSLEDMREFAETLARGTGQRLILLLSGPMGAGKTQFTRFYVEALGSQEASSPSFAIHNSYHTHKGLVEHLDLFRLESAEDLESTGFWDFFRKPNGIIIIEWAEKLRDMGVEQQLPANWPRLSLVFENAAMIGASDERRFVTISDS